ncbi:MAG: TonB-dependent receptor [Cytophagaceae bacterium]|nr:TonB-dependent receptor [Cytophagaceae bacterium]
MNCLWKGNVFVFFVAIFFAQNTFSQENKLIFNITGVVRDSYSGKPLAGVNISVNSKKNLGSSTDSSGRFHLFFPKGNYSFRFSSIGYSLQNFEITIEKDTTLDIRLKDESKQLDEVVISATSNTQLTRSPSIGVTYLNIKGIKKLPAMLGEVDLLRSIQTLPGVSSVGEGANGINIRGGNVDQNFVLVDEAPIFNPTHLFGLFSVLTTDAIRNLELYKGGIPARFGGRVASVLDIKMIEANTDSISFQGGIGPISNKFLAEIPLIKNKLSLLSASRFSFNDFWFRIFAPVKMKNTRANFLDLTNKLFFKINSRNSLSVSTYFSKDYYRMDSLFSLRGVIAKQTAFNYGQNNISLKWNKYVSEKLNFELSTVHSLYKTRTQSPDSVNAFVLDNYIKYQGVKFMVGISPGKNQIINAGINAVFYEIMPGELNKEIESAVNPLLLDKEKAAELSAFLEEEWTLSPRLAVRLGVRGVEYRLLGPAKVREYSADFQPSNNTLLSVNTLNGTVNRFFNFEPRASVKIQLSENENLKIGYNRMGQFLQLISNNTTPLPTARWKLSDNNIKPQISNFISAGYFRELSNGIWEASAEMYFRHTKNVFDYVSGADLQLNPAIETQLVAGKARSYGLELMFTKRRGRNTGWLGYTYSRTFQKSYNGSFGNDWYPSFYDRPHALNFTLNTVSNEHNAVGLVFTVNSGRPFTSPTGTYVLNQQSFPLYSKRNNDRLPVYHRLDFSWTITNPGMKVRRYEDNWVFAVYNLYGRKNVYSIYFKNADAGIKAYSLGVFSAPIISLTYNFKF